MGPNLRGHEGSVIPEQSSADAIRVTEQEMASMSEGRFKRNATSFLSPSSKRVRVEGTTDATANQQPLGHHQQIPVEMKGGRSTPIWISGGGPEISDSLRALPYQHPTTQRASSMIMNGERNKTTTRARSAGQPGGYIDFLRNILPVNDLQQGSGAYENLGFAGARSLQDFSASPAAEKTSNTLRELPLAVLVPTDSSNSDWKWKIALELPETTRLTLHKMFYGAINDQRKRQRWQKYNRTENDCILTYVIGRGSNHSTWDPEHRACKVCVKARRPCAQLVLHEGELRVGIYPLPDQGGNIPPWTEISRYVMGSTPSSSL
jgi:hypothetical protein